MSAHTGSSEEGSHGDGDAATELRFQQAQEELREQARYLRLLNEITHAASDEKDLQAMLKIAADRLGAILRADSCYITLWDEARQQTTPIAASSAARQVYPHVQVERGETTMTRSVLQTGQTLIAEDVSNTPYISPRIAALFEAHSMIGLPLIVGHQKHGVALIGFNQPHRFTPEEVARGEQAAAQIALAVAAVRLQNEVQRLVILDELTGVFNRRHLLTLGEREVKRAHRQHYPLTAIMFDIDDFKTVNDGYGYLIGDQVLRAVSRLCAQKVRTVDILGRYGGEEFVILLPETDHFSALAIAERLRLAVAETTITTDRGDLTCTISLGVAPLHADDVSLSSLLNRAEEALSEAKQGGRNCVASSAWFDF